MFAGAAASPASVATLVGCVLPGQSLLQTTFVGHVFQLVAKLGLPPGWTPGEGRGAEQRAGEGGRHRTLGSVLAVAGPAKDPCCTIHADFSAETRGAAFQEERNSQSQAPLIFGILVVFLVLMWIGQHVF